MHYDVNSYDSPNHAPFRDRADAGRKLADALQAYARRDDAIVLGLARGGVPVASEVARTLDLPLDVVVARKLGAPFQPELALGAVALGGVRVVNHELIRRLGVSKLELEEIADRETEELHRSERLFRGERDLPELQDKIVILVDDGLATGSSMRAAIEAVKSHGPARLIVAVPVGAPTTCVEVHRLVSEVVCLTRPHPFMGVSRFYEDFRQVSDGEVQRLLR